MVIHSNELIRRMKAKQLKPKQKRKRKLSDNNIQDIKSLYKQGYTHEFIAKTFYRGEISRETVRRAIKEK